MKIVVNLEKLSVDGFKQPANSVAANTPNNITHAQLRYDNWLSPNLIQGVFVSAANSTVEFTVSDSLLVWTNFKLFTSTNGVDYTENKSFGGSSGKDLISSSLSPTDYLNGEYPVSNGTAWLPKTALLASNYLNGEYPVSNGTAWLPKTALLASNFAARKTPVSDGTNWNAADNIGLSILQYGQTGTNAPLFISAIYNGLGLNTTVACVYQDIGVYDLIFVGNTKTLAIIPTSVFDNFTNVKLGEICADSSAIAATSSLTIHTINTSGNSANDILSNVGTIYIVGW